MVFGGFWEDLPVIFQGDPPPLSKRVVMLRLRGGLRLQIGVEALEGLRRPLMAL